MGLTSKRPTTALIDKLGHPSVVLGTPRCCWSLDSGGAGRVRRRPAAGLIAGTRLATAAIELLGAPRVGAGVVGSIMAPFACPTLLSSVIHFQSGQCLLQKGSKPLEATMLCCAPFVRDHFRFLPSESVVSLPTRRVRHYSQMDRCDPLCSRSCTGSSRATWLWGRGVRRTACKRANPRNRFLNCNLTLLPLFTAPSDTASAILPGLPGKEVVKASEN